MADEPTGRSSREGRTSREGRGGDWRKAFLGRDERGRDERRGPTPEGDPETFKSSVLAQDREMLERLQLKGPEPRPERARKGPAIPKVKPFRPVSDVSVAARAVEALEAEEAVAELAPPDYCPLPEQEPPRPPSPSASTAPESSVKRPASPTASTATGSLAPRELREPREPTGMARLATQRVKPQRREDPVLVPEQGGRIFSAQDIDRFLSGLDGGEALPAFETPPPATPEPRSEPPRAESRLQEKMQEMDALIEQDMVQRAQLERKVQSGQVADLLRDPDPQVFSDGPLTSVADVLRALETARAECKAHGVSAVPALKAAAQRVRDFAPELELTQLVRVLKLFASCQHADPDLYLRLLGELPMLMRQATPALLTELCAVLRRLRLREETYLDLFAMETMNHIRAKRRKPVPKPPAAPKPAAGNGRRVASAGAGPDPDDAGPFSPRQLVKIGNALALLDARPSSRFVEIFQEEMARVIPTLSRDECEVAAPAMVLSLFNDRLKRAFLERCAEVQAGMDVPWRAADAEVAPDLEERARQEAARARRCKHIANVYVFEQSVRKETFSFYSSLPADVRAYLDGLHETAGDLPAEPPSAFAVEVGGILEQLGVKHELSARAHGALGTHVLAEGTNITRAQVYYECIAEDQYFANTTTLTPAAKLRQRLFDRLGVKLTSLEVHEWQKLSEAQKVNTIVKLHSYHAIES